MSHYNRNWDAENITQSMHRKDAPNVFITLEKQVTTKDAKKKNMEELHLKELNKPTYLKNMNMLQREKQWRDNYAY